jgi:hypothetical protein
MTIPLQWTAKVLNDPKAKKALEDTLYNNTIVLDRLREILYERENAYTDTLFSLSTPKDIKERLIERIGELKDIIKLLNI